MSDLALVVSYAFHLIATVVWLGGLVVLSILVYPQAQRHLREHPQTYVFLNALRRRFVPYANFSLAVLVATGMVQMSLDPNYQGFLDFSNTWSVALLLKHIAILGMVVCSLALQYGVAPALERTTLLLQKGKGDPQDWERLHQREVWLTWLNNLLGLSVLGFTAWMTAL